MASSMIWATNKHDSFGLLRIHEMWDNRIDEHQTKIESMPESEILIASLFELNEISTRVDTHSTVVNPSIILHQWSVCFRVLGYFTLPQLHHYRIQHATKSFRCKELTFNTIVEWKLCCDSRVLLYLRLKIWSTLAKCENWSSVFTSHVVHGFGLSGRVERLLLRR